MNWLWRALLVFANALVCATVEELPQWLVILWMLFLVTAVLFFEMLHEQSLKAWRNTLDKWEESLRQQERDPADWWKGED